MTENENNALKVLATMNLDAVIEEKLAMIAEGEKNVAALSQEAQRLSIIVAQRRMDLDIIEQWSEGYSAAVRMFGRYYRHEIGTGQHQGKSVGALVVKYFNRERNLMVGEGWRFSLARWIAGGSIDYRADIPNSQTTNKPTQVQEGRNNG